MAKKEGFYQIGICPQCPEDARQSYVDGLHECRGEMTRAGRQYVYGDVHTISIFRCDGCGTIIIYRTYYADAVEIEEAKKLDKKWVFQLDDLESDSYFRHHSSIIYPTHQSAAERPLSHYAPKPVRKEYEEALKVKHDPKSFAMRIRRALEAICLERGLPGENLDADLKKLSERGELPLRVAEIGDEIKVIGNAGAHVRPRKPRRIRQEDVQTIDDVFHLVVTYVYEAPARLKEYNRKLLRPKPLKIISEDTVH